MNDLKFDILNAPTAAQSELDIIMQRHIDSGLHTKEELAEIRKRESNKLKEDKDKVKAKVTEKKEEPKKEEPKRSLFAKAGEMYAKGSAASVGSAFTAKKSLYTINEELDKEKEEEEEENKKKKIKTLETNKKIEEKLMDDYGTTDANEILKSALGDDIFTEVDTDGKVLFKGEIPLDGEERLAHEEKMRQIIDNIEMPDFGDNDVNEYIYKPFVEFSERTKGAVMQEPWLDPSSREFKNTFFHKSVDKSGIVTLMNLEKAQSEIKEDFYSKYNYDEGLDVNTDAISNYIKTDHDKAVFKLMQNGEFDKAAELNEEKGIETLYKIDNTYVHWRDLTDAEKQDANLDNVKSISKEDEIQAQALSQRVGPEDLRAQNMEDYFEVVAAIKNLKDNTPYYYADKGLIGELFDVLGGSKSYKAIEETYSESEIQAGLEVLKGDRPGQEAYNEALRKWKVTGRALELNQDVSTTEYSVGEAFTQGLGFGEVEKEAIAFEDVMGEAGKIRKDNEFTRWNTTTRRVRSTTETVKVIAEIGGAIYLTKKIPIGAGKNVGGLMTHWKRRATVGTLRSLPVRNALIDGIVTTGIAGAAEVVTLTAAEPINQEVFGGHPFILNTRTGEIHPEGIVFGATLGMMGPITQGLLKVAGKNPVVRGALASADDFAQTYKVIPRSMIATTSRKALEAGVGTVTLLAAEYASGMSNVDYSTWKELNYTSETEMREKHGLEHIMNNYLALAAFGALVPGRNNTTYRLHESYRSDLARYQGTTKWAKDGSKVLGLKKPNSKNRYTTETIDKALLEKIIEVENSNLSDKAKREKIQKLKKAAKDMHFDNELQLVNEMIKNEDLKRKERLKVFNLYLKKKNGQELTAKEKEDFASLTEVEIDYFKARMGIVSKDYNRRALGLDKEIKDSEASKDIDNLQEWYKGIMRDVVPFKISTDPKARLEVIDKMHDIKVLDQKINALKNKKSGLADSQRKELKEEYDLKVEELQSIMKKFDKTFDAKAELVKRKLEKLGEELGQEVEFVEPTNKNKLEGETDKQYEQRIEKEIQENYEKRLGPGGDKKSTGFHEKTENGQPDKLVINPVTAKKVGTLGVGIHEIGHHILRDVYKERYFEHNGKEYTLDQVKELKTKDRKLYDAITELKPKERLSQHGVDIIEEFLETLSSKERKILNEYIAEGNYRFKDVKGMLLPNLLTGKPELYRPKKNKSEYYEEYLTHYLQALKDGKIKLDRGAVSKMGDVIIPQLQKYGFTNAGRGPKKGGEKYSIDNAEGLKKLLNDIYVAGERGTSKYELANFMKENAAKVAKGFEAFGEISYSKYPEMERINKLAEGNYEKLLNEKIEGTDKNKYTKKEAGEKWNREWKGPENNPLEGRWKEVYDNIAANVFDVMLRKTQEFNRMNNGIITEEAVFAWDVVQELGGLRESQIKIGGHVRNFDITQKVYDVKGKDFGISGWINDFGKLKLLNVLKTSQALIKDKKLKSLSEEGMKEMVDPNAIEMIESSTSVELNRRIVAESKKLKLHEVITQLNRGKGNQAKEIHNNVRDIFTNKKGEVEIEKLVDFVKGKDYKSLPGLMLPQTIKLFVGEQRYELTKKQIKENEALKKQGKPPKHVPENQPLVFETVAKKIKNEQNLDGQDIAFLQRGLNKFTPIIHDYVIPEGFTTKQVKYINKKGEPASMQVPAKSTGVPRKIQAITHSKRSISGETDITGKKVRTKENFTAWRKKDLTAEVLANLREAIGFMKDGTLNQNTRKNQPVEGLEGVGETIKGLLTLTDRLLTSQPIREMLAEHGRVYESSMLALADGKASKSYAKGEERVKVEDILMYMDTNPITFNKLNNSATKEGLTFDLIDRVFGNEVNPLRSYLENKLVEAKGLEPIDVLPKNEFGYTKKQREQREKTEATQTKDFAIENGVNPNNVKVGKNKNKEGVAYSHDLTKQQTTHHATVLNGMPFHIKHWPKEAIGALYSEFAFAQGRSRAVMGPGGKIMSLKINSNAKDAGVRWMETIEKNIGKDNLIDKGVEYDGRYDACFTPKDFGKLKTNIDAKAESLAREVKLRMKKQAKADMELVDFVRAEFSWNNKSSGFEATMKANKALAKDFLTARFEAAKAEGEVWMVENNKRVKKKLGLENIIVHNAMQSNISTGISKAFVYNIGHIARIGSKPGTYTFPNKKGVMTEYTTKNKTHWEHERQLLNNNEHWINIVKRHKKLTPEALKDINVFIETSTQSLVPKSLQLKNDAKGQVTYSELYGPGGKASLTANAILNVLTTKGAEANQLVMSGPYKGKTVAEQMAGEFTMKQLKEALPNIPKDQWGPEAYTAEATNLVEYNKMINNNTNSVRGAVGANYSRGKSKKSVKEVIEDMRTIDKAIELGRLAKKKSRGMSAFDFDETVGISDNYVIAKKGKKTKRIASAEWPFVGEKLKNEGWKMDFSDFNKVTKGKPGPLMEKMKNQIKKFGPENVFILTARAKESAPAIHEYLKSEGINIPLKNITGLGNSTGEAKAMWMLKKFEKGYNDMYFVDDALPNVKAVKEVLDQLDIKSDVQIARQYSRGKLSKSFNDILQEVKGVKSEATFSEAKGRLVGEKKGKFRFGTPGMEDFAGLVTYKFAGKGKRGEAHKKFFEDNLQRPFSRAYNEVNKRKQSISEDYKALRKAMPEARKLLGETVDGIYTVDQAVRVYNFNKAGYEIPGLSKTDLKKLTSYVESNPKLVAFANQLSKITMLKEGYIKPADYWLGENITMDMNNVVDRVFRKEALAEFVENRKEIFGEWKGGKLVGENMNKIESIYGPKHREALESMLWRMENGTNRRVGADSATNKWMNWINSATGTIMFFNQKSAALQTISSLNYVNGTFNNPLRAAQAFANQPQYWKDFVFLFNSPMLLQRRAGLKINIEAAELLERVGGKEGGFARFRKYILEKGFIPTKYADSFAIASGGATFYRNSIRKYKKQGMSEKEAQERAFEDFQQMTEATQQSSRPDLISMQQASGLGRPILAFANTPMQMFRRHKRRLQDIANRRGNTAENVLSAVYYGFAQTMIFSYLANAMFAVDDESEDEDDKIFADTVKTRFVQTIADSYLRGMGLVGAGVSAIKNGILSAVKETKKANADYGNTVIDLLNISPPIGSKARKLYSAGKTYKYNKKVIPEMGFRLDNPAVLGVAKVVSAFTNLPADRVVQKLLNIKNASNSDFENWQRIAMFMGLSNWSIGAKDEKLEAEMEAIEKRIKRRKKERQDVNQIEVNKKKQEQEKKKGVKDIKCAAVSKSGSRCSVIVEPGSSYCTIHAKVKQNKSGKKVQCKKIKSNKKRCGMKTSAASGYCYYHD